MIFGRKKKGKTKQVDEQQEVELVQFRGTLSGREPNMAAAGRLVQVGLLPAKELVTDGLQRRSELLRIDPRGAQSVITLMIDGVAYPAGRLPKQEAGVVTQMLKLLAGLNVKVRNKQQVGGIKAIWEDADYEFAVQVKPVPAGERLILRSKNLSAQLENPLEQGFSDSFRRKVRDLAESKGFIGVVGQPHSGTTTTTYAVVLSVDPYLNQIFTIGSATHCELPNIADFEAAEGEEFREALERCFRKEADVIFCDPIRDAQTAKTILNFHKHGALIAEFAAQDAAHGLAQLIAWTKEPALVAEAVRGIFSQRLIRVLCDVCKEAYRPNPQFLSKAGLSADLKLLYRAGRAPQDTVPCEKCGGVGFYGRQPLVELVEMTDSMRKLVAKNPKPAEIKALARKESTLTYQKEGLRLVGEGLTSIEELQRAFKKPRGK